MFRKKMKNFYIALFFLPILLVGEPYAAPKKQIFALQFENAAWSPHARMILLMESLSNQVNQLLPSDHLKRKPIFVSVTYKKIKGNHLAGLQLTRQGNYKLTVPDDIRFLETNPEALSYLVSWHILARMGMKPEAVPLICNSWFVTGLVRRLQRETHTFKAPFSSHYPAAYTLTSIRKYPLLSSVATVSLPPEDTTLRILYEEYSELLLHLCSKHGMFRNGMLVKMLDDSQNKLNEDLISKRFFVFLDSKLKTAAQKKKGTEPDLERWFQNGINAALSRNFLPVTAATAEIRYEHALHFTAKLKKQEKSPEMLSGNLEVLLSSYDKLESPITAASQMGKRLLEICRTVSPDLIPPIRKMHSALIQFGKLPGEKTSASVRAANQSFYTVLEKNLLLEKFLEETERQCVAPAARYQLTLALLEYRKQSQISYLQKLTSLLNKTEGNVHKP